MANEILNVAERRITESAVDIMITPLLKGLKNKARIVYNDYLVPKGEHFKKYLDEAYEDYSSLNTLVFHDRIKSLKEIYLPLTLINKNESIIVDGIPVDLIKRCKRIQIIDTAGMGKSTMMKRMFIDIYEKGLDLVGIPLFIDLRRLKENWSIVDEINKRLSPLSKAFDNELLLHLLEEGGFVFFLDGYDEISLNVKEAVTQNLQDFIIKAYKNYFILTSRPGSTLGFNGFETYSVKPLEKEEAYTLLKNYDRHEGNEISTQLIKELEQKDNDSATEFLKNPLLTSLLYNAFDYENMIPSKKHLFYEQVYDAFFQKHDLKKGDSYSHDKSSGLEIDDFSKVLSYIGFYCLKEGVEYSQIELLEIIHQAKTFCGLEKDFNETDFLSDIQTTVPLFCKENQSFKWAHISLMEYFAALFIARDSKLLQDEILETIYCSKNLNRFINMLDIYYDLDEKGFSKNITLKFCKDYLAFYKANNWVSSIIDNCLIEERIGSLFRNKNAFIISETDLNEDKMRAAFKELGIDTDSSYSFPISKDFFVCCAGRNERVDMILNILSRKLPLLFNNKEIIVPTKKDIIPCLRDNNIKVNTPFSIKMNTGGVSNDYYVVFNSIIVLNGDENKYCNHGACVMIVKDIQNDIINSNNKSVLLKGI